MRVPVEPGPVVGLDETNTVEFEVINPETGVGGPEDKEWGSDDDGTLWGEKKEGEG